MKLPRSKRSGIIILILLLALVLRLYMLIASSLYIPVTSDESITVLQAKEIISGQPSLFVWAQPYQFPVETYMLAPIVNCLPRNGFGARFHSFVIGFLSLAAMLLIFRRMGSLRENWMGLLLVLFPSAYLMMIQFGYPIPHYTSAFLLCWIAILSAVHIPGSIDKRGLMLVALTGLFCGLAFTNNMVTLAIVLPVAIVVCWGTSWRRFALNVPVFGTGVFAGLLPFLLGIWCYPEAHAPVTGTRAMGDVFSRLWSPAISHTLPRALGVDPGLFPDSHHTVQYGAWLLVPMAVIFILVLLYGTVLSAWRILEELKRRQWPKFTINEIFIGASWLGIMIFLMSKRAGANDYRYLAPVAWSFPFVCYYSYNGLPWRLRPAMAMFVIMLACFNVGTTLRLINAWTEPDYGSRVVGAPPLEPALDFLEENNIRHCVASHWLAYRISFATDEKIICSQPYNERFPGWDVPYKFRVDNAENVTYVLTDNVRFLKPGKFEDHMAQTKIASKSQTCGLFKIYYDFEETFDRGELVPSSEFSLTTSDNPRDLEKIKDGDPNTFWRTDNFQGTGMWVQVEFVSPRLLNCMTVNRGNFGRDYPEEEWIEKKTETGWEKMEYEIIDDWGNKFHFEHGHPVYGGPIVRTFLFQPQAVQVFRLYMAKPRHNWAWTINELKMWQKSGTVGQ